MRGLDEIRRKLENPPEDSDYYVHWDEDVRVLLAKVEELEAENERLKHRVNRMLTAGMGKDWGDGFEEEGGYE